MIRFDFVSLGCIHVELIKTHGSVSCGPKIQDMPKLRQYINRNNKVTIFYALITLIDAKVAEEVPAYQGRLLTKFEENLVSHFQHMSEQTFMFFTSFYFSSLPFRIPGILVGHSEAIIRTNFCENLYKI